MSKKRSRTAAERTGSPVARAALLRSGGGVHADQNQRRDARAQRRAGRAECRGAW